jgi:hypothetical protein
MQIHFHGGHCCGVKTISGFYDHPGGTAWEKYRTDDGLSEDFDEDFDEDEEGEEEEPYCVDIDGSPVRSEWDFFHDPAPKETYRERLIRMVEYLKVNRPGGLVEVVLTSDQMYSWGDILKEIGFVQYVPEFRNSNSGATLYTLHLIMKG